MYIDIIVGIIMVLSILLGLKKGFFFEVLSFFLLVLIIVLSKEWTPSVFLFLKEKIGINTHILYYIAYGGIFISLYIINGIILSVLRRTLPRIFRGVIDSILGGILGIVKGSFVIFVFLMFYNLLSSEVPKLEKYSKDSKVNCYFLRNVHRIDGYYPNTVMEKLEELKYRIDIKKKIENYMSK